MIRPQGIHVIWALAKLSAPYEPRSCPSHPVPLPRVAKQRVSGCLQFQQAPMKSSGSVPPFTIPMGDQIHWNHNSQHQSRPKDPLVPTHYKISRRRHSSNHHHNHHRHLFHPSVVCSNSSIDPLSIRLVGTPNFTSSLAIPPKKHSL